MTVPTSLRALRGARLAATLFPLAVALACARAPDLEWIDLCDGFRPTSMLDPESSFRTPLGREVAILPEGSGAWLSITLGREEWSFNRRLRAWEVPLLLTGFGKPADGRTPHRLRSTEREFQHYPHMHTREPPADGTYVPLRDRLVLRLEKGAEPPAATEFRVFAGRGLSRDGGWVVEGERFSGAALPIWPGETARREVRMPARSTLRFATCIEPAPVLEPRGSILFRVRLDGAEVFRFEVPLSDESRFDWHAVPLPTAGVSRAAFTFEVEGPLAFTSFFQPTIGPSEIGSVGDRPWGRSRPDLILFLADTFRADNMGAYGGLLDLTPELDRLAGESLVFEDVWSVSTFTLPAHASMFTGVYPRQAGMGGRRQGLGEGLATVAEILGANGYRTAAITDAILVSRRYGLHRGFSWFDEHRSDLDSTLARVRAILDADDGRPLFLFVQSYRTHSPYVVSEETLRSHGERLRIEGDLEELARRRIELENAGEDPVALAEVQERIRAHYLGGVVDLDRGFRRFLDELESRSLLERGHLVFTSDHGEGFFEHGEVYHGGRCWEEQVRIPLFLTGGGIQVARIGRRVSLVDLTPTLAALAGLPSDPDWEGRSLFDRASGRPVLPPADRAVFAFECRQDPTDSSLAIAVGNRKLIAYETGEALTEGRLLGAFDLARDPAELEDLHAAGEGWVRELLARHGAEAARLLESRIDFPVVLDEKLQDLYEMGYVGDH